MAWVDDTDITICFEPDFVDTQLAVESMHGVGVVVTMIDDVIVVSVNQEGMMSRSVNGSVGIGLQNAALIGVWTYRTDSAGGILHTIGVIMATT